MKQNIKQTASVPTQMGTLAVYTFHLSGLAAIPRGRSDMPWKSWTPVMDSSLYMMMEPAAMKLQQIIAMKSIAWNPTNLHNP
jgi:hypothetical protein